MFAVRLLSAILFIGVIALVGCGSGGSGPPSKPEGVKVSGKILLPNGSPVTGGILVLRPESGLYGATATIQSNGTFTLQEAGTEQVIPGKYQVFLRFSDPQIAATVPAKYQESSEDTDSDVVVDIQSETSSLEIRLKN